MHPACKAAATLVLALGLVACGTAPSAGSEAASAASVVESSADASAGSAASASEDTRAYENDELGISYALPSGFSFGTPTAPSMEFYAANSNGVTVTLLLSQVTDEVDPNDPATMAEFEQRAAESLVERGVANPEATAGTYRLSSGAEYPAVHFSGEVNGHAIAGEQIFLLRGGRLVVITATTDESMSVDELLAPLSIS